MALSSEDQLRLNVLLAQDVDAIRIDESSMTVCALSQGNEARVPLSPNCRPPQYLRFVRELLSNHALGSPGGYPVFLQRWTRMGQAKDSQLANLLRLGEPEAVVAVAGAPGLTDELARRVWWLQPTSDIARRMLECDAVVTGRMGRVLAQHLVEHLPFETDPLTVITTVKLVLKPGLVDDETRRRIWSRGTQRNAYHLGFLEAAPDALPDPLPPRPDLAQHRDVLRSLGRNPLAELLARVLDSAGQTFLAVSEAQLRHPLDKFTAALLMDRIGEFFAAARAALGETITDVTALPAAVETRMNAASGELAELLAAAPRLRAEIAAVLVLGQSREALITPIISRTTASGTLLRRKLEPVTAVLLAQYAVLRER